MKLSAALRSRSASTEQVVRTWPTLPFWLRRRASRETHLSLPGAAVSATAILATMVAEPSLYRPGLHLFAFSLPAGSLAVLTLLAPLSTGILLAGRQAPAENSWRWAGWLPVCGLFAVAAALSDLDRAGSGIIAGLQPPQLPRRPSCVQAARRLALRLFAPLPARKGMAGQALLFASHLGWLLAAAGELTEPQVGWGFLLLGVVGLHLLAVAGARLMTTSARWQTTLATASWADRLVPPCLLLPVPLNLAASGLWLWPRTQAQQNSLAAEMFEAQGPLKLLASFRRHLPAGGGLATHFKWNGDLFSRLAESRLRRELPWTEMHRVALFFQALALLGTLGALGLLGDDRLVVLFWALVAITFTSSCLHALLYISGWISRTSRGLTGLSRVAGVAFAFALALAASPVWFLPAGKAAFGLLAQVCSVGAILSILRLPLDVLASSARIRSFPPAFQRGMTFLVLAVLLAATGSGEALTAAAQIQLVAAFAVGSFFGPPLLVYLAERFQAPALVRSRWLCLPFSALLLPLLPSRLVQKALRSSEI